MTVYTCTKKVKLSSYFPDWGYLKLLFFFCLALCKISSAFVFIQLLIAAFSRNHVFHLILGYSILVLFLICFSFLCSCSFLQFSPLVTCNNISWTWYMLAFFPNGFQVYFSHLDISLNASHLYDSEFLLFLHTVLLFSFSVLSSCRYSSCSV